MAAAAAPAAAQVTPPAPEASAAAEAQEPPLGTTAPGTDPAAAATPAGPANTQEIVVTGSRIARRDYTATSPIVTVNQSLLEQSPTIAIEQNLNKLPQFTPAQTPTQGGDIQSTATNTPGAATVSLRGLGPNRNLVLIDGRRATPGNANLVVDINTIPAAAIERVEVITGGASSTYGADAVAGVVNFILRKNFQGLELDGQTSVTQRGDGFEYRVSGFMGANFADNRGNITFGVDHSDRNGARRDKRRWFRDFWADPGTAGTEFFSDFPHFVAAANNAPNQAVVNGIFSGRPNPAVNYPNFGNFYFNPNGTAFGGFDGLTIPGAYRFTEQLGLKYERLTTGQLAQNWQDELATFPLDRWNIYSRGQYEINDDISVITQGYFNRSKSQTIQQPSPAVNGWSTTIPVDGRALPAELAALLASRPNPTAPWQLNNYLNYANRVADSKVFTYQLLAGLQGRIPGTDWTWEAYGSHGQSNTSVNQTGFASLQRYRAVISAPNWGQNFRAQGNAAFGGFGAASATCTSGLNPFDNIATSADCIEAISADVKSSSDMEQSVWEATLQGGLVALPAGDLRFAIGADYRRNRFEYLNDTLTTQGRSFLDQAIGLYPSGNSRGTINVKEAYGELLIPLLKDLPLIKRLELEIGGRVSDYNTTGNSYTYKINGDWEVTDWFRLRGGYNKAERAPNIAELYQARQQVFAVASGGDLCSTNNPLPYSAGAANTTNRAQVRALCEALMNRGDPQTAANFYANPANQSAGPAFVFVSSQGNANLTPEIAKTWTVGGVLSSPVRSALFRGLRLSVDYYNIEVTDAIGLQTSDIIQRQCFDTAFNPSLSATSPFCTGITRNVGIGTIGDLLGTYLNSGRFRVSGIDAQLDWSVRLDDAGLGVPGTLSLNAVVNYLDSVKSAVLPVLPLVEYRGTFGPATNENGLSTSSYRWRSFTSLTYAAGPVTATLQWQHLPSIKSVAAAVNPATTIQGAPAYNQFNLMGTLAVTRDVTFRFGVENLTDKAPPLYEVNAAPPAGTTAGGQIGGTGAQGSFYDVLGRRFFMGIKARF
ncbi:MAG: TonB-dependent receptor [Sphingomonas fennica]